MQFNHKVIFNVLAKDLDNAKDIIKIAGDRVLIGVMMKDFATEEEAIDLIQSYQDQGIPVSVGLGAADPYMWKRVANVAAATKPPHINQIFSAAAYTLGRLEELGATPIINGVIEPSGTPGEVYLSTGPLSSNRKEKVSCNLAASLLAEVGVHSVKFYPIKGDQHLDEVAAMVQASVKVGLGIFEPTGGITLENVDKVVKTCLDHGAEIVIPHLYTSLVNKETGETDLALIEKLLEIEF